MKILNSVFILFFIFFPWNSFGQLFSNCKKTFLPLEKLSCPHKVIEIDSVLGKRKVAYAIPRGWKPWSGWPVAIIFQGSFFKVDFERTKGIPFGGFNEIRLIQKLLDKGFAVIAPRAFVKLAWQTNIIGIDYEKSGDKVFINNVLDEINAGTFGDLNYERLYAVGISSGGYMTDRMIQSHGDRPWKGVAIAAASYANCKGPICNFPKAVAENHPPTLFLHGEKDLVVPVGTMEKYHEHLVSNGVVAKKVIDPEATHQWLDSAPKEITDWFVKFKK